jgi:hypothetical protein
MEIWILVTAICKFIRLSPVELGGLGEDMAG